MTEKGKVYDTCKSSSSESSRESSRSSSSTSWSSSGTTTTTTTVYTESGVFCERRLSESEKADIFQAYKSSIGDVMRAPMASQIARLVAKGMDVDVIVHAIDETGMARRPSPWYLRAILNRYDAQGLYSLVQVLRDEEQYAAETQDELPW